MNAALRAPERPTPGQFGFLPELSDPEIRQQIEYGVGRGYDWRVEHTDDPRPGRAGWEAFAPGQAGVPGVMKAMLRCRWMHPGRYVRLVAVDPVRETSRVAMCFIVNRPTVPARVGR